MLTMVMTPRSSSKEPAKASQLLVIQPENVTFAGVQDYCMYSPQPLPFATMGKRRRERQS